MTRTDITSGFWAERLRMNARSALYHQWQQLEASGCIDNFRIAAGQVDGFREGYFFADSDAYKWLEAAYLSLVIYPDPKLQRHADDLIALLEIVQTEAGYINTYNQVHFPGQSWVNLQVEHELYCLGHLIEAGLAYHTATGQGRLLDLVRRTADLLVRDFMDAPAELTDGHEEIELALLRLYRHTGEPSYLELGRRLIEKRGRMRFFPRLILRQYRAYQQRDRLIKASRKVYLETHPDHASFRLPPDNPSRKLPLAKQRRMLNQLSGKYFQQHAPIRQQTTPVGHSVRFTYLQTAVAMLAAEASDPSLLNASQQAWRRMVERRMYVTGGLGALPFIEGFGRDYELDPQAAYAETCAALGSLRWNLELAHLTGESCFADLFEWQLYNAASVGMGLDGRTYLYNNPLACQHGEINRLPWYLVPCCPSNLSRIWAALGGAVLHQHGRELRILQYISSESLLDDAGGGKLHITSALPWQGQVQLSFDLPNPAFYRLNLRLPSWAGKYELLLNDLPFDAKLMASRLTLSETACGYNPTQARALLIERDWQPADRLSLNLELPIRLYRQHPKIKSCRGMLAIGRGPLVYCLESLDQPGLDLFSVQVDPDSLEPHINRGIVNILGKTRQGDPLVFIPYMQWGNRGPSAMTVLCRTMG